MKGRRTAQDGPEGVRGPGTRPKATKRRTGRVWQRIRAYILHRDGYTCQDCGGRSGEPLEVHHVEPLRTGGTDHPDNLTTLCRACHGKLRRGRRRKGRPDRETWRRFAGL